MSFVQKEDFDQYTEGGEIETYNTPLKKGGSSFKTKDIIFENGFAYTKPSKAANIFQWMFFILGDILFLFGLYLFLYKQENEVWILVLIGVIFSAIGFLMMRFTKKVYFDKAINVYHDGRGFDPQIEKPDFEKQGRLKDIKALQIVKEKVKTQNNHFYSYEINLVLNGGNRINVVDHANLSEIKGQAEELSRFLDVPILGENILNDVPGGKENHFKI